MKLKTLILSAIGLIFTAAAVLVAIAYYGNAKSKANKGLLEACNAGNAAAAAYWLAKGADIETPEYGFAEQTPLMACAHLNSECVETLLLLGADPNAVDSRGLPVLHRVQEGYIVDKMLLYGLDLNKTNKEGLTALQYRLKNHYIMDERLKTSLEGKGPVSKMFEKANQEMKAEAAAEEGK